MMTFAEFEAQIEYLSLSEQLALLESLSRHIRLALEKPTISDVRGILYAEANVDDQAFHDDYTDYLEEKYR
jgi:hypothetical protein